MSGLKDHEIQELVNILRDKLRPLTKVQSLREMIHNELVPYLEAKGLRIDQPNLTPYTKNSFRWCWTCAGCKSQTSYNPCKHCGHDFNNDTTIEELKELCKELLVAADKCGKTPHYIVQPFLGIVKRHLVTINKHDLI